MASQPPASPTDATMTSYDALGDVSTVTQSVDGATTRTTQYGYDNLGRKISETDPQVTDGLTGLPVTPITRYSYDLNGNLLSTTDPDLHTTWTDYDALNRVVKTVSADGSGPNETHYATTTVYDAVGNVLSVTDPDGNVTSYVYDNLNRQIETVNALHFTSTESYDGDGDLIRQTDFDGRTTQYLYDADGQQIEEDWPDGNGNVIHATKTYYDCGRAGHRHRGPRRVATTISTIRTAKWSARGWCPATCRNPRRRLGANRGPARRCPTEETIPPRT